MSLHEDWAKAHRWWALSVFVVLAAVGLWATIEQSRKATRETTKANTRLSDSLDALRVSSDENARLARLNTELQGKLLLQSEAISGLSKQAIATTTGADSFCFMSVEHHSMKRGAPKPTFHHVGRYPLYEVRARIVDIDKDDAVRSADGSVSLAAVTAASFNVNVGNLAPDAILLPINTTIPLTRNDRAYYNVFFDSPRNGFWHQNFRAVLVDGEWRIASQVWRFVGKQAKVIWREVHPKCPRDAQGRVVWN